MCRLYGQDMPCRGESIVQQWQAQNCLGLPVSLVFFFCSVPMDAMCCPELTPISDQWTSRQNISTMSITSLLPPFPVVSARIGCRNRLVLRLHLFFLLSSLFFSASVCVYLCGLLCSECCAECSVWCESVFLISFSVDCGRSVSIPFLLTFVYLLSVIRSFLFPTPSLSLFSFPFSHPLHSSALHHPRIIHSFVPSTLGNLHPHPNLF